MNLHELKKDIISSLPKDFFVFLHGIENHTGADTLTEIAPQILAEGLHYNYMTAYRTIREKNQVQNITEDDLNYAYFLDDKNQSTVIMFAIPSFLPYKNRNIPVCPHDMLLENKNIDDGNYRSFFDCVLSESKTIPKEFIFGCYSFDGSSKEVEFQKNSKFLTALTEEEYSQFCQSWMAKIKAGGLEAFLGKNRAAQDLCKLFFPREVIKSTMEQIDTARTFEIY